MLKVFAAAVHSRYFYRLRIYHCYLRLCESGSVRNLHCDRLNYIKTFKHPLIPKKHPFSLPTYSGAAIIRTRRTLSVAPRLIGTTGPKISLFQHTILVFRRTLLQRPVAVRWVYSMAQIPVPDMHTNRLASVFPSFLEVACPVIAKHIINAIS
jgi:hypothetical protein